MSARSLPTSPADLLPMLPLYPVGRTIPKILHQVYSSRQLPEIITRNVERLQRLNPGWEYRFYDDEDMRRYIHNAYGPEILAEYECINRKYGASRADLFRYLVMYREGGVYLDIKASLEAPLDRILLPRDEYVLSHWPAAGTGQPYDGWGSHSQLRSLGGREFQQWHIMAAPGHPFLRAVIEKVRYNIAHYNPLLHDTGKEGVLRLTGPIAYTQAIAPLLGLHSHRLVETHTDLGLIYSVFGMPDTRPHASIFRFHYTALTEPVANVSGVKRLLWAIGGPFHTLRRRCRQLSAALARRFSGRSGA